MRITKGGALLSSCFVNINPRLSRRFLKGSEGIRTGRCRVSGLYNDLS